MVGCDILEERTRILSFRVVDLVKDLDGSSLVRDSKMLTQDKIVIGLSKLRMLLGSKFNNFTNFPDIDIRQWLVDVVYLTEKENLHRMTQNKIDKPR